MSTEFLKKVSMQVPKKLPRIITEEFMEKTEDFIRIAEIVEEFIRIAKEFFKIPSARIFKGITERFLK